MRVYRAGRRGSTFAAFGPLKEARSDFVKRIGGKGPFRWKKKNAPSTDWSRELGQPALMRNFDREVPTLGEDNAFWAKVVSTGSVFVLDVGEAHIRIPDPPSGISASIAKAHRLIFREAEIVQLETGLARRIVTMGYSVCKWINGIRGGTPSQHCPGPPTPTGANAMDWVAQRFVVGEGRWVVDLELTDRIVRKLESNGFPEVLWRGVANHYPNHAHTSGNPKRSGTPVCL
ncbi:MAG TPA: hypothetical protein VFT76_02010 [Actinomycetota bacterium]|nr:hypothetical protein [Actinomycetota bacterium]